MSQYTLAEVRNGTGWPKGTRFVQTDAIPDGDYVLAEQAAWFTVGRFAVRIRMDGEQLYIDAYPDGQEMMDSLGHIAVHESEIPEPEEGE